MEGKVVWWAGRRLRCQESGYARVWRAQCNQLPWPINCGTRGRRVACQGRGKVKWLHEG